MSTTPIDLDGKGIDRRHDWPRRSEKRPEFGPGHVVDAIDLRDVETVHHPFGTHHLRPATVFFGGLENQRHAAREIARLNHVLSGPQQHRRMAVMAAGMHLSGMGRCVFDPRFLEDRQCVEIRTQPDRRARTCPVDDRHNARLRDAFVNFVNAEFLQPFLDKGGGLGAVKAKLRNRMQMSAPFCHQRGKISDAVDDGHWVDSCMYLGQVASDTRHKGAAMGEKTKDALIHDQSAGIERLLEIMRRLRDPETGCPWDIEQDFGSIAPYTIEEAYEVADAIDRRDWPELEGELGDLLLQTVYHTAMGEEDGHFTFQSVVRNISDKMVARHPHVFGDESRDKSADQQTADWEKIKAAERAGKAQGGALDGVAVGLPALLRAYKLQKRAARVGFDWPDTGDVVDKIAEEAAELVEARETLTQAEVEEEFGDLMFVMANLGRHLGLDPEAALRAANAKFIRRFEGVEARLSQIGKTPADSDLAEMDALWDAVKRAERS